MTSQHVETVVVSPASYKVGRGAPYEHTNLNWCAIDATPNKYPWYSRCIVWELHWNQWCKKVSDGAPFAWHDFYCGTGDWCKKLALNLHLQHNHVVVVVVVVVLLLLLLLLCKSRAKWEWCSSALFHLENCCKKQVMMVLNMHGFHTASVHLCSTSDAKVGMMGGGR